jgi:hypothetical protein
MPPAKHPVSFALASRLPVTGQTNLRYAAGKMRIEKLLRAFATAACLALPRAASAQDTGVPKATAAREHFERARMYYGHGAYREAIDEALTWFRLFMTMDLTPQERERVDAYAKRLEGAKKELDSPAPSKTSPRDRALGPEAAPFLPAAGETSRASVDGLTVGALSVSGAGLVLGIVMGLKAEVDAPAKSYVTGVNGSFNDFQERHNNALRDAVIADVGFGVAIAGAVTGAYLYFLRPRWARPKTTGVAAVSVAPLPSGGALLVQGRF